MLVLALVLVVAGCVLTGLYLAAPAGVHPQGAYPRSGDWVRTVAAAGDAVGSTLQIAATGCALIAAIVAPVSRSGLSAPAWWVLRRAARFSGCWLAVQLLTLPVFTSDLFDVPLRTVTGWVVVDTLTSTNDGRIRALGIATAATTIVIAGLGFRRRAAVGAMAASSLGLLAVLLQRHDGDGGYVVAGWVLLHVVGASVWVGGVLGLLVLARRSPPQVLAAAVGRFSSVAAGAALLVAASGVGAALARAGSVGAVGGAFGAVVALKVAGTSVVLAIGTVHRRLTMARLRIGARGTFVRWAVAEAVVFGALIGLGAVAGRLPAGITTAPAGSTSDAAPGFLLPSPLRWVTTLHVATVWAFLAVVLATGYLLLVAVANASRPDTGGWPAARTCCWLLGCVVVLLLPGVAEPAFVSTSRRLLQMLILAAVVVPLMSAARPWRLLPYLVPLGSDSLGARRDA